MKFTRSLTKLIYFLLSIIVLYSCQKDTSPRELNIKYISKATEIKEDKNLGNFPTPIALSVAPNPFTTFVNFFFSENIGQSDVELFITDSDNGYKKIKITERDFTLDFSAEKDGSYYFEVRYDNEVIQDQVLKISSP